MSYGRYSTGSGFPDRAGRGAAAAPGAGAAAAAAAMLGRARRLELAARKPADGQAAGDYRSAFRGNGIEFSEMREYRPGDDDVRAIDWKVTARLGRPHVRQFVEERDLRVYVAADLSGSGRFGSGRAKSARAAEVAASLLAAAARGSGAVGAFFMTDSVERSVPARSGTGHALKVLAEMLSFEPRSARTDLAASLRHVAGALRRRSLLFVLSDFMGAGDYSRPLRALCGRHDVVAVRVADPRERELPDVGLIQLEDEETGEQELVDTSDARFRAAYAEEARRWEAGLEGEMGRAGADMVTVMTDDGAYEARLRGLFRRRAGGRGRR